MIDTLKHILPLLSRCKSELMGFSILLIMAFHTAGGVGIPLLNFKPFLCGDIGVEFFLVLSAMGCYFSMAKNPDTFSFYKRRLMRLLPTFIVAVALAAIILSMISGIDGWTYFLANVTFYSLLKNGDITYWFMAHIMLCYLLMPLLYKVSQTSLCLGLMFLLSIGCFAAASCLATTDSSVLNVSLCRYPIFLISIPLAVLIYKNRTTEMVVGGGNSALLILIFLTGVYVAVTLSIHGPLSKYMIYFFVSIPMLVGLSFVINLLKDTVIGRALSFVGSISLELYLLHAQVMLPLSDILTSNVLVRCLISYSGAIVAAYLIHQINSKSKK